MRTMQIPYIPEHTWQKTITADPFSSFGKNSRMRLKSSLKQADDAGVTHAIEPLTPEILAWFTPLYNQTIGGKENPKIFDIEATTLGKNGPHPYYALILHERGTAIGATIFSLRKTYLSIAYRIYPNDWTEARLQAKPSLYSEYLINRHAHQLGYAKLSHGRDRNPYGPNAQIGLAIFKLSIGCIPMISADPPPEASFDPAAATCDTLIFERPASGRRITQGYLICDEAELDRYRQVMKYPEQVNVDIIPRR